MHVFHGLRTALSYRRSRRQVLQSVYCLKSLSSFPIALAALPLIYTDSMQLRYLEPFTHV